jgi:hypothetical protein
MKKRQKLLPDEQRQLIEPPLPPPIRRYAFRVNILADILALASMAFALWVVSHSGTTRPYITTSRKVMGGPISPYSFFQNLAG